MIINKNDFIGLEFIGRVKNGGIFDTNIREEARKLNPTLKEEDLSPTIICIGQGMILPAIDKFLIGKELGKSYKLELSPEEGFGERKRELLKTVSINLFKEQQIQPQAGVVFSFDGVPARISAVSGGRVILDFNNPLAGKNLVYELRVNKKIDDLNKKVSSLLRFFFKKKIDFEIKEDKDKKERRVILKIEKQHESFVNLFKDRFKEILNLNLEIEQK